MHERDCNGPSRQRQKEHLVIPKNRSRIITDEDAPSDATISESSGDEDSEEEPEKPKSNSNAGTHETSYELVTRLESTLNEFDNIVKDSKSGISMTNDLIDMLLEEKKRFSEIVEQCEPEKKRMKAVIDTMTKANK